MNIIVKTTLEQAIEDLKMIANPDVKNFELNQLLSDDINIVLKEIERLNNIIKEVREFAKLRKEMYERQENVVGQEVIISLLNILEKGE